MDGSRFDALTRLLALSQSRRRLAALVGGSLAATLVREVDADKKRRAHKARAQKRKKARVQSEKNQANGNDACAHFCDAVFPAGPERGACKSAAAHGAGLCPACLPDLDAALICGTPDPRESTCCDPVTEDCCASTGKCQPKCTGGQVFDPIGCKCNCLPGRELCQGQCVALCPPGTSRGPNCTCTCAPGTEICGAQCVPVCPFGFTRGPNCGCVPCRPPGPAGPPCNIPSIPCCGPPVGSGTCCNLNPSVSVCCAQGLTCRPVGGGLNQCLL
jgi:hypothetical protein